MGTVGILMTQQDQDVENRLKCLKSSELTELLDFIIPNRANDRIEQDDGQNLPPNGSQRPH